MDDKKKDFLKKYGKKSIQETLRQDDAARNVSQNNSTSASVKSIPSVQKTQPQTLDSKSKPSSVESSILGNKDNWICDNCGADNRFDNDYCTKCGGQRHNKTVNRIGIVKVPISKFCRKCGSKLESESKVCPKCGTAVINAKEYMRSCAKCGAVLLADDSYCGKCGTKYEDNKNSVIKSENALKQKVEADIAADAGNTYSKKEHDLLYAIEHQVLRDMFFSNPVQVAAGIAYDQEKLYTLFSGMYSQQGIRHTYAKADYRTTMVPFYNKIVQQIITLPDPPSVPLCKKIIIFLEMDTFDKLAYYTVERTFGGFVLCAWTKDGAHLNMGPIDPQSADLTTLQYYCDANGLNAANMIKRLPEKIKRQVGY